MKTFGTISRTGLLLVAALAVNTCWALPAKKPQAAPGGPVSFVVISDPHLYNARLGTSGSALEEYLFAGDPKLVKESEAVLEAALAQVAELGVRFVIISGDLTKDGEIASHVLLAQHLQKLEQAGIEVFVVPGNHDINNSRAVAYLGDMTRPVPNTSPETFRALYQRFGYGQAIGRDRASLSYVAEPAPGLWLLAIDSAKYQGDPADWIGGRISAETMTWILATLQDAQAKGKRVIAFLHHGVNAHFLPEPVLFPDYLLDDWPIVSAQLAAAGLQVVFTGHYHSQDAAYPLNQQLEPQLTLCDVETGSLVQYPCAFRVVTVGETALNIRSVRVEQIDAFTGGLPFQQYAEAFLRIHMEPEVIARLEALLFFSHDEASQLAPVVIDALVANYVGDEAPTQGTLVTIRELASSPDPRRQQLAMLLAGIWTDLPPADNQLVVPFTFGQ